MKNYTKIAGFLIIFALAFLIYLPAVKGTFHFDDFHHIVNNPAVSEYKGLWYYFSHPESFSFLGKPTLYRPITMLSFAFNYMLFKTRASCWLIFNILLHSLNCGLLFLLLLKWRRDFEQAIWAGLIFAGFAIFNQPVNYLSERSTLFAVCFVLIALIFDWDWVEKKKGIREIYLFLALVFFWLGLFSKETASAFPFLVLLLDLVAKNRAKNKKRVFAQIIYWLSLGVFLLIRYKLFGTIASYFYPRGFYENLLTQAKAVFFYLGKFFYPIHLSVIPELKLSTSILEPLVLVSLVLIIFLCGLAIYFRSKLEAFSIGWGWFLAGLAPSAIIPLNVVVNEERVYLAGIGLIFWLVAFLKQAKIKKKSWARIFLAIILILQIALIEKRIPSWRSELSLWQDAIRKSPHLGAGYVMYANALLEKKRLAKAMIYFNRAVELDPNNPSSYAGLCAIYMERNDPEALRNLAERYFEVAQHPVQKAEALAYLSWAELMLGNREKGLAFAKEALSKNPREPKALYVLAVVAREQGDTGSAINYAQEILNLAPDFEPAHSLLGLIFAEKGEFELAYKHFKKYTELRPRQAEGWLNLGLVYMQMGKLEQAKDALKRAIQLKPKYALANYNMALVEYQSGKWEEALDYLDITNDMDPDFAPAHYARAKILLEKLKEGIKCPKAKKEVLDKVKEEISWLESHNIPSKELKEELEQFLQK